MDAVGVMGAAMAMLVLAGLIAWSLAGGHPLGRFFGAEDAAAPSALDRAAVAPALVLPAAKRSAHTAHPRPAHHAQRPHRRRHRAHRSARRTPHARPSTGAAVAPVAPAPAPVTRPAPVQRAAPAPRALPKPHPKHVPVPVIEGGGVA